MKLCILTISLSGALSSCEGLAVSYTRDLGGQSLTGFVAADGTYGVVGKKSGKEPVKVDPQK